MSEENIENKIACMHCEELYDENDDWFSAIDRNDNEIMICKNCYDSNDFKEVNNMHEVIHCSNPSLETVQNDRGREILVYIESNLEDYYNCCFCNTLTHIDFTSQYYSDGTICHHCTDSNVTYCENEGYYVDSDSHECCHEDDDEELTVIKSYSYKPKLIFTGSKNIFNPFMGIELEVEKKDSDLSLNDAATNVIGKSDLNVIVKHDGSLNSGFEIVTHPYTLDEYIKRTETFKSMFQYLSENGYRSHDTTTCGLHIHIDKRRMSEGHKKRLGVFFELSNRFIERLARRKCNNYCEKIFVDSTRQNVTEKIFTKKIFKKNSERYRVLNWQNENTVEIRIFKGTLKHETFLATIEFCHAVYNFTLCKHSLCCEVDGAIYWKRFLTYISKKRDSYKFLHAYIDSKFSRSGNFNNGEV